MAMDATDEPHTPFSDLELFETNFQWTLYRSLYTTPLYTTPLYTTPLSSVRYFFLNKGSSSRVFLYIYTKVLLAHVMDSTVACPVKGDGGGGGGGVQGQRALHLPPPLHAAPVGGGGHLQLAVGRPPGCTVG